MHVMRNDTYRRSRPLRTLSAVISQGAEGWVAQCLEVDVAAQGSSLARAIYELQLVLQAQALIDQSMGHMAFETTPPAPAQIREKFENGIEIRPQTIQFSLPNAVRTHSNEALAPNMHIVA